VSLFSRGNLVVLVKACHLLADVRTPDEHPGYFSLGMEFNTPSQVTGLNARAREEEHWTHGSMVRRGMVFGEIVPKI
jgi:hypothetical protein